MLACTGFLPGDDPRMRATIDAIAERLTDERGLAGEEMIGNYPQAFSHIGLVNAAWAITEAERRRLRSAVHPG
jgi:GH15 family glucan-1,4-alpha-glucosidase